MPLAQGADALTVHTVPPTGHYTCSVKSINSGGAEANVYFPVSLTP